MNRPASIPEWLPAAVLTLGFLVISPGLWTGWIGDDGSYSALNGVLGANGTTLWQAMRHAFDLWFYGYGRFYPGLIFEKYLVFALFTNVIAYKAFLIATTLLVVELFRRCVQAYTTRALGTLAALIAVALFLEHAYQDPLLAYNAMPQLVAVAMLSSFLTFRKALLQRSRLIAIVSIVLYAAAALTYEDVYPLCVLYPVLARSLGYDWRSAIRAGLPAIAIAVGLTLFDVAMRARAHVPPDALYAVNFQPAVVAKTAIFQLTAALPLASWLAGFPRLAAAPAFPIIFAGFALMGWIALRELRGAAPAKAPFVTGLLLLVLPAMPIAPIVKYQSELHFGVGYLPVFFQMFGVALILAGLSAYVRSRPAAIAITLALAALGTVTYVSNVQLAAADRPSRTAREALQRDLSAGLLNGIPDGAIITAPKNFAWITYDDRGPDGISTRGLFYMFGRHRIDLEPPDDARALFALSYSASTMSWSIRRLRSVGLVAAPPRCNASTITNGDFTFGSRCWAMVGKSLSIESAGACLPQAETGNPFAAIQATPNGSEYLAQTFIYRATPTTVTFRVWSTGEPVTASVGIVFPVATGAGTERILAMFVPPSIGSNSGACTGKKPTGKSYTFSGFARGARIQIRLHAASGGGAGAADFDDITSSP